MTERSCLYFTLYFGNNNFLSDGMSYLLQMDHGRNSHSVHSVGSSSP